MAKSTTKSTQNEELMLLDDHKKEANALINKLETEILPHISYLSSLYDTLEMDKMTENDFKDLIENSGKEVSVRYQSSLEEKFKSIPYTHLIGLASTAAMTYLNVLLSESENAKNKYLEYFKYLTFNGENETVLLNSTKVEIYDGFKEYESKSASELRKKHQLALDAVNDFFLVLKQGSPDYLIMNRSLVEIFDLSPNELQKVQPFQLRKINYKILASNAENHEKEVFARKVETKILQLEEVIKNNHFSNLEEKIISIIGKLKEGTDEERLIAESEDMENYLKLIQKRELEKSLPKIPRRISANPSL